MTETIETESATEAASPVDVLVMRYGCTGTHGGVNKMCDHCANNINNYPETPKGKQSWRDSKKISEMVCRLPVGPDKKYWTQYIALHQDA